jgi:hypothetical protein
MKVYEYEDLLEKIEMGQKTLASCEWLLKKAAEWENDEPCPQ